MNELKIKTNKNEIVSVSTKEIIAQLMFQHIIEDPALPEHLRTLVYELREQYDQASA